MELEEAAAAEGLVLAMVRTNEEFRRESQYTDVLSRMPLITVEKIGESDPVPLKGYGNLPLAGVRALGMGHVIAGAAIGRDLSLHRADVLNIWRPRDSEIEALRLGCPMKARHDRPLLLIDLSVPRKHRSCHRRSRSRYSL